MMTFLKNYWEAWENYPFTMFIGWVIGAALFTAFTKRWEALIGNIFLSFTITTIAIITKTIKDYKKKGN